MRLFLALPLSERTRREIDAAVRGAMASASGFRWVAPDALHLTLRFLGEADPARDERLRPACARAASAIEGFRFRVGGSGCYPPTGRPRVLWLGVAEPTGALARLQAALEVAAVDAGFPPESRPFHAHLTLARARATGRVRAPDPAAVGGSWSESAIGVGLFESRLAPSGARYTALATFPLRGGKGDETESEPARGPSR